MSDKKVDESWKDKVESEKEADPGQVDDASEDLDSKQLPPVNFSLFITSLGMQALMALGEIENPTTNKREKDLDQAKYLIDTIGVLQEKTKGNLDKEENEIIEQLLYELRIKFLSFSK